MTGPQRQSQSLNSSGEAPFGSDGNSTFPPPPPPEDSHDAGIGATPKDSCPWAPRWNCPSWGRPWSSRTAAPPCRARPWCRFPAPCKARSWWGRSPTPCEARSWWGSSPKPRKARSWWGSSPMPRKARSWWGSSPVPPEARSCWRSSPTPCEARSWWRSSPTPRRARSCCGRSPCLPPFGARSCWGRSPCLPPCRARSCRESAPHPPSPVGFQYPDSVRVDGTATLSSATFNDRTSRSNHACFASWGERIASFPFSSWGFHWTSPFFTRSFDSHVSYKLLTKLVPSTSGSPATVGNGGIGGNIGSSTGGGPFGTLVPFGVNRFESPFSQASGLTARSRVLCLGVLLPPLPWRSAGKVPLPLEPSTEVPFTADHGDEASPEPAFICTCCSCPLRHSNSCMSLEFWHLKNSTSSPSRARCKPSLPSSIPLLPADLTWPCDKTGSSHPCIRPSVLSAFCSFTVGPVASGISLDDQTPRPFPVGAAPSDWTTLPETVVLWGPNSSSRTGNVLGLFASSKQSAWTFSEWNGLTTSKFLFPTGMDWDLELPSMAIEEKSDGLGS